MRPTFLRLRGFLGVKRGLGIDELVLDLKGLDGLIALSGENGRSKSTVLENLSPYRTLFSRSGSLNLHTYLRDSEKEFHFTHEGHEYRTLLKIDAESERGEAFVWMDGVPQVDGKRQSYDQYIDNLLGSRFLFQNSVLCAQDSRKLTDLRTGELRELFAEFLRLDRLQGWETTSKGCINVLDAQRGQIERRIADIGDVDGQIERKQVDLFIAQGELDRMTNDLNSRTQDLDKKTVELADLNAKLAAIQETERRRIDAEAALKTLEDELKKLCVVRATDAEYFLSRQTALNKDLQDCLEILAKKDSILQAERQIEELEKELTRIRGEIDVINGNIKLQNEVATAAFHAVAAAQKERDDLRNSPEIKDAEEEIRQAQSCKINAETVLDRLKTDQGAALIEQQIAQCEGKMKDLDARDPDCHSATCSFIVGALDASRRIPDLQKSLADKKADLETKQREAQKAIEQAEELFVAAAEKLNGLTRIINGRISEIDTYIKEKADCIRTANEKIDTCNRAIKDYKEREEYGRFGIESLKKLEAKATEIAAAEAKATELQKQVDEVKSLAIDTEAEHDSHIAEKSTQVEKQKALVALIGESSTTTLELQQVDLESEISKIKADLADDQRDLEQQRNTIATINATIAGLQASRDEIEVIRKDAERLGSEISEWTYIRDACSKTGLQALEIDGVCPHIQYDANNLLFLTFGSIYSIRIQTYDELENKEVFKIWVIREDGSETSLDNLSGGQKVWILKALRLALTSLSKHKSGRNFLTCYADEEDGGLSVENARAFVNLYRSFMTAGGFESFYYITHKPECLSVADHIITFKEGGVDIG